MTTKEYAEGNKKIMLFDGWELQNRQTFTSSNLGFGGDRNTYQIYYKKMEEGLQRECRVEDVEYDIIYHKSWDAIMPIVIKINKMKKMITINLWSDSPTTECKIYNWGLGEPQQTAECENPLQAVWEAVVKFIDWNNQK